MNINRPPLGWNSWNTFGGNISEDMILRSADVMVESGLKECGYEYIVIDDCWAMKERDKDGRLVADPVKFPHGMKYVADYIHSKGLKFGMYSCAGYWTCAGYPGSFEYEWIDAKTFAEWGVDFLKYDYCYHTPNVSAETLYRRMGLALANSGRDILFSACSWGSDYTRQWVKSTGAHMWRSTGDIVDSWASIKSLAQSQIVFQEYNGQGSFNDMDMLVVGMNGKGNVGVGGCTFEEYKLHFSLWALLSSPLMIGCDIRNMSDETKKILMNKEVLKINQDPACREPFFVLDRRLKINENRKPDEPFYSNLEKELPIIAKFLDNGDIAIGLFNFTESKAGWGSHFLVDTIGLPITSGKTLELTDLWSGEKIYPLNGVVKIYECDPHSCRLFRAKIIDLK